MSSVFWISDNVVLLFCVSNIHLLFRLGNFTYVRYRNTNIGECNLVFINQLVCHLMLYCHPERSVLSEEWVYVLKVTQEQVKRAD